jgi:hypothetical protein
MDFFVEHVDVWAARITDDPGALAGVLAALSKAGADLDFVIGRRSPDRSGEGVVFVTPIRGDTEVAAAGMLGFNLTSSIDTIRVQGENKPGAAAAVAERIGKAGINVRGFSAAVIGSRFIAYVGFDNADDAQKAVEALKRKSVAASFTS